MVRVSDFRVVQAQRHGVVVGLPAETGRRIAAVADFLAVVSEWRDLAFLFDELERHEQGGWKVPVDRRWWLAFEWAEGIGPVDVRLVE
jgi:hypothetical protein